MRVYLSFNACVDLSVNEATKPISLALPRIFNQLHRALLVRLKAKGDVGLKKW